MPESPESLVKFCKRRGAVVCETVKNFKHCRIAPPELFTKKSFRTKTVDKKRDIKITVACPKGKYDAKKEKCKVGMRAQKIMYPVGVRPSIATLKKLAKQAQRAWC